MGGLLTAVVLVRTVTDQSVTRRIGPAASALQPDLQENKVWIGNSSGIATPTDTGAKGRDLLALANDAALQSEIVARIAGATIAPEVINATGKISTANTADDSIETAGGVTAGSALRIVPAATNIADLRFGNTANPTAISSLRIDAEAATTGDVNVQLFRTTNTSGRRRIFIHRGDGTSTTDIVFETGTTQTRAVFSGGATPASATAGQTNIGNGIVDTAAEYRRAGTKILGAQGAAVADATDASSAITQLNALLARCRAHGLIAT